MTVPQGLSSPQIENLLYNDSNLSEEDDRDDSDYIELDRESDDEGERESAPAHSSSMEKGWIRFSPTV